MFKLKNIGKTKTLLYRNGKLKKNEIEWTLNSDNKNGMDLNINMNDDGNNMHYHQNLTNRELEELLKNPVVNKSLEERLMEDFKPYDNDIMPDTRYLNYHSPHLQPHLIIMPTKKSKKIRPFRKFSKKIRHRPKLIQIKIYSRKRNNRHNRRNRSARSRSRKHSSSLSS
jgi:hypothetical protein